MTDIRIVRDYAHSPAKVWRALTDPTLMALWGMRPEGFAAEVGTRFRLVAAPNPQWRGWVECEVLEVVPRRTLRVSWDGGGEIEKTYVTYSLAPHEGGTRLVFEHAGFTSSAGIALATTLMTEGWTKVFDTHLPAVLVDVDEEGALRAGSLLVPTFPRNEGEIANG